MWEADMERAIVTYLDNKAQMEKLKDQQALLAAKVEGMLRDAGQTVYVGKSQKEGMVLRARRGVSNKRELNKDALAQALGVLKSDLKTPFLLECAAKGKLTPQQFEQYYISHTEPTVSIKEVPGKKKKGE